MPDVAAIHIITTKCRRNLESVEKCLKTSLKFGDIVSFGGERASQCYFVGMKGNVLKLFLNRDVLGSGYMSVPLDVSERLKDALRFYEDAMKRFTFTSVPLSHRDATIKQIFTQRSKLLVDKTTTFEYDDVNQELHVSFKGLSRSFAIASVNQKTIESHFYAFYYEFSWTKDTIPTVSFVEKRLNFSLKTGDIVNFGGERGTNCYFVTHDGSFLLNDDELGMGYISIPLSITKHIYNVTKFYSDIRLITSIAISADDVYIQRLFSRDQELLKYCTFVYDNVLDNLNIHYVNGKKNEIFAFPFNSVTIADVKASLQPKKAPKQKQKTGFLSALKNFFLKKTT